MDILFFGIIIGLAIAGILYLLVMLGVRRKNAEPRSNREKATSSSSQDKLSRQELRALESKAWNARTHGQYDEVRNEIDAQRSNLTDEQYKSLVDQVNRGIEALKEEELRRAAAQPKLAEFRALKNLKDENELFRNLHYIRTIDEGVISIDELSTYGEDSDYDWLDETYDRLLVIHLRQLLINARSGTIDDYQKVMTFWEELSDYTSGEGEDRDNLVETHLASEWNEMIVRFKRNPVEYTDIFGLDEIEEDDYKELVRKARKEGDLLSLRLVLMITNDFGDFSEALMGIILKELEAELDAQLAAIGFRPGEEVRSA